MTNLFPNTQIVNVDIDDILLPIVDQHDKKHDFIFVVIGWQAIALDESFLCDYKVVVFCVVEVIGEGSLGLAL